MVRQRQPTGVASSDPETLYSSYVMKVRCLHPQGEDDCHIRSRTAQSFDTLGLLQRCSLRNILFLWHLQCFCPPHWKISGYHANDLLMLWASAIILHGCSLGML